MIAKLVSRINVANDKLIIELKSDQENDQSVVLEAGYAHIRKSNDSKLVLKPKDEKPESIRDEQLVQLIADSFQANKLVCEHPNLD